MPQDLLLVAGQVLAVADPGTLSAAAAEHGAATLDCAGLIVAPGLIDIHVHLREPGQTWKETIASGTRAAAAGGFTTVVAMPNTVPVIDTPAWASWLQAPERGAAISVLPMAAATVGSMGETLTDYAALRAAGAVGVTDDGKPIGVAGVGDRIMRDALELAARCGLPVSQHAEDTRMTRGASMNAGALAFRMGLRGMSVESERSLVERDIALVRQVSRSLAGEGFTPHLHVQHISTRDALELVRGAKQEGLHVTCEVMPHHFALNESALAGYNTFAKMNPPLRSEADRLAMLEGLLDGTVDCIATDHAPHAAFEKEQEFEKAPNGITGLETALGLSLRILHGEHGMPLAKVLALLSWAPAQLLALAGRGTLAAGARADVVVFDPAATWHFNARAALSKSKNSPFDGWAMQGRVRWTLCGGQIVFEQGPA
ncbi:dihydroorotase [Acidipila sp. EB88]|nr:dihydroorotase [Acidipila sp. EB88]